MKYSNLPANAFTKNSARSLNSFWPKVQVRFWDLTFSAAILTGISRSKCQGFGKELVLDTRKRIWEGDSLGKVLLILLIFGLVFNVNVLGGVIYSLPAHLILSLINVSPLMAKILPTYHSSTAWISFEHDDDEEVGICHQTGSSHNAYIFMRVKKSALSAHQAHGDIINVDSEDQCPKGTTVPSPEPKSTPIYVEPSPTSTPKAPMPTAYEITPSPVTTKTPGPATSSEPTDIILPSGTPQIAATQSSKTAVPTESISTSTVTSGYTSTASLPTSTISYSVTATPTEVSFPTLTKHPKSTVPPSTPKATSLPGEPTATQQVMAWTSTPSAFQDEISILRDELLEKQIALEQAKKELAEAEARIDAGEEGALEDKSRLEVTIESLTRQIDTLKDKLIRSLENDNAVLESALYKEIQQEDSLLRWTIILAILAMITEIWPKEISQFFRGMFKQPNHQSTPTSFSSLEAKLLSLSPVPAGSKAVLVMQAHPGREYLPTIKYKSSKKLLEPKTASSDGKLSWTWQVARNTTPGKWTVRISSGANQYIEWPFEVMPEEK